MRPRLGLCSMLMALAMVGAVDADAQQFTTINAPSGSTFNFALDVNDKGEIVGLSDGVSWLRRANGQYESIDCPGADGGVSVAGLNNLGQVVGTLSTVTPDGAELVEQAFMYQNGVCAPVANPGPRSGAYDINDAGVIVGWYGNATTLNTFLASPTGVQILTAPNAQLTNLTEINNVGTAVGLSLNLDGSNSAWQHEGGFAALSLPATPTCPFLYPTGITDTGTILATCNGGGAVYLYPKNGPVISLTFAGRPYWPQGISSSGTKVVGYYADDLGGTSMFLAEFGEMVAPCPTCSMARQ